MWKGIGSTTTLLFSLNRLIEYMMVLPEVKRFEKQEKILGAKDKEKEIKEEVKCKQFELEVEKERKIYIYFWMWT